MPNTKLKKLIERIERLEEEKRVISADISEVYAEAKAEGFDTKAMREVVKIRRRMRYEGRDVIEAEKATIDLYLENLADLPLFSERNDQAA